MSLALTQSKTALGPNLTASFLASGGAEPYVYTVVAGGAGGSIDPDTGLYMAPSSVPSDPSKLFDIILVTDDDALTAQAQIMIGTPLLLFCEIIQNYMNLNVGRVYLWDQKIPEPTDAGLYVAVSVLSCKPFGNTNEFLGASSESKQSVNMYAQLQVDIISRGPEARDRKEEIILALNSDYAQTQQEGNSFYIGKLPPGSQFVNVSSVDGAAIPYRFNISVALQYFFTKTVSVPSFDSFVVTRETIEP